MLLRFYRSTVENVIGFSVTSWYARASEEDKNRLNKVVMNTAKTIGCDLPSIAQLLYPRIYNRAKNIKLVTLPILPMSFSALCAHVGFVQLGVGVCLGGFFGGTGSRPFFQYIRQRIELNC